MTTSKKADRLEDTFDGKDVEREVHAWAKWMQNRGHDMALDPMFMFEDRLFDPSCDLPRFLEQLEKRKSETIAMRSLVSAAIRMRMKEKIVGLRERERAKRACGIVDSEQMQWRPIYYAESDYDNQTDFDHGRYFLLRCDNKHAKKTRLDDPYIVVFIEYPESLSEEIRDLNNRYPMEPVTHYLEIIEPK